MISYLDLSKEIFCCLYHGIDHPLNRHLGEDSLVFFSRHLKQIQEYEGYFRDLFTLNVGKSWNFWLIFFKWVVQPATSWLGCANRDEQLSTGWLDDHFSYFSCSLQIEKCLGMRKFQNFWGNMFYYFFKHRRSRSKSLQKVPFWGYSILGQVGAYFNTYLEKNRGGARWAPINRVITPINGLING